MGVGSAAGVAIEETADVENATREMGRKAIRRFELETANIVRGNERPAVGSTRNSFN